MILMLSILLTSMATFCMVVGDFGWQNIVLGLVVSGMLMYVFRREITPRPMPSPALAGHILVFLPVLAYYLFIDILKGTWLVAKTTLGIEPLHHPGIIKYPIPTSSPYGAGPVAYFITLSPGSFLVDIDWEENVLLVHVLDASDPDGLRRDAEKYYRLWGYRPERDIEANRYISNYEEVDTDE